MPQKHVIGFFGMKILMNDGSHIHKDLINNENIEITSYKYAGELAGNEEIPEGQQFRVKKTGEIFACKDIDFGGEPILENGKAYNKTEIEPYFN